MNKPEQPVGNRADISVKPARACNLEEDVDKDRVHAEDEEEGKIPAVAFQVDPPIAEGQGQEAPTPGRRL